MIAQPLIEGLRSEVVVRDPAALRDFNIRPMSCARAISLALDRYRGDGPQTTWFDTFGARLSGGGFRGGAEGVVVDRHELHSSVSAEAVFRTMTSLGGERGWLYGNWLWRLRAGIDWFTGGGLRRGRRSATSLRIGDVIDFWVVEALVPNSLFRLRATMRLPGRAWLEFAVVPEKTGSLFRMTA